MVTIRFVNSAENTQFHLKKKRQKHLKTQFFVCFYTKKRLIITFSRNSPQKRTQKIAFFGVENALLIVAKNKPSVVFIFVQIFYNNT